MAHDEKLEPPTSSRGWQGWEELVVSPRARGNQRTRVHVHAYERLSRLVVEIQKSRFPSVSTLARIVERTPRTVQRDLDALRYQFGAPLAFDRSRRGYCFADPSWRFPEVKLSEGELIAFFAAERILRRLGATSEAQLTREALKKLGALLPAEVVIDVGALADAISFAPDPALKLRLRCYGNWLGQPRIVTAFTFVITLSVVMKTLNARLMCCWLFQLRSNSMHIKLVTLASGNSTRPRNGRR